VLQSYEKPNRISIITKVLSIIPIVFLVLGFWSYAYVEGYYIDVEGNLLYSFPIDQQSTLILDSTIPGEFHTILEDNPSTDWLVVIQRGELPEGFDYYPEGKYITVEGPLPPGSEINMAWTLHYQFFRAINVSTNEMASFFGVYPKNLMESLGELLLYATAITLVAEVVFYRYNKRKKLPTVINYYKTQFLIIKKEILVLVKK